MTPMKQKKEANEKEEEKGIEEVKLNVLEKNIHFETKDPIEILDEIFDKVIKFFELY